MKYVLITRYSYECTENRGICETLHKKQWEFQVQQAPRMLKIRLVSITVPAVLKWEDSSMRKLNNSRGGDLWILTIRIPFPNKGTWFLSTLQWSPSLNRIRNPKLLMSSPASHSNKVPFWYGRVAGMANLPAYDIIISELSIKAVI